MLGQNSTHADTHVDQGTAGTRFDEICYAEESIEEWAEQDLISFDSFSAPLEPGTVSATSEDSMTGITEELCYGMVSHCNLADIASFDTFLFLILMPPLDLPHSC